MLDDIREPGSHGRPCYLHHGQEEVLITYPAALDADTARRIVRGVLDSGRVSRPAPLPAPGGARRIRCILPRLWIGAHVDDGAAGSFTLFPMVLRSAGGRLLS
jgi:hypothetical protein